MERNLEHTAQMLPDDMLADVLSRLPPRSLAVSRCVCTAWRAVIDARRLLRPDLLPLSLAGVFVNYVSDVAWSFAELFSLPSPKKKLVSSYPPGIWVRDHCNGLLLHDDGGNVLCVLNPATGWRMALPECPRPAHPGMEDFRQDMYLVFDPTVSSSSHFEVFLVPRVPFDHSIEELDEYGNCIFYAKGLQIDTALLVSQWPLSPCILNVFSSATGRWEKRSFHRDGEGAGTVADMQIDADIHFFMRRRNAVYFRGALYIHCEYDFVMRISLSTNKYHMIKPPPTVVCKFPELHLGKSENGIYFALLGDEAQLWVWILAETNGQPEWILRHSTTGAGLLLPSLNCTERFHAPWILHHVTSDKDDQINALAEHNEYELNSDRDEEEIIFHNEDLHHVTSGKDDQINALAEHNEYERNSDRDEGEIILHNKDLHHVTSGKDDQINVLAEHNEYERNSDRDEEEIIIYNEDSGYLEILAFHPHREVLFLHRSMKRGLAYHLNSSKLEDLGDLSPNMPFIEKIGTCFPYTPCWI